MDWEKFYKRRGIIVTDRYVTSNMVHQASKITDEKEKHGYLNWLETLEYEQDGYSKTRSGNIFG